MSYKGLFKDISWDICLLDELPWEEVYVDCDSLIFRYMLEYIKEELTVSYETLGANIFSTDYMINSVLTDISKYSLMKLKRVLKELNGKMQYTLVFGDGKKMHSKFREESYKDLKKNNTLSADLDSIKKSLTRHVISRRDDIRDIVVSLIDEKYIRDIEPDILCSKKCLATISLDYDLFLFGSRHIIKDIKNGEITFLSRESMLKKLGLNTLEELVTIAVLCGTDYNMGVNGIGPKKARSIDVNSPLIDKDAVKFFLEL